MVGAGHPTGFPTREEFGMRNRNRHYELEESFDPIEWPDAELEVDDRAFAQAIAQGRGEELAA
jgi:hypothetical protein